MAATHSSTRYRGNQQSSADSVEHPKLQLPPTIAKSTHACMHARTHVYDSTVTAALVERVRNSGQTTRIMRKSTTSVNATATSSSGSKKYEYLLLRRLLFADDVIIVVVVVVVIVVDDVVVVVVSAPPPQTTSN